MLTLWSRSPRPPRPPVAARPPVVLGIALAAVLVLGGCAGGPSAGGPTPAGSAAEAGSGAAAGQPGAEPEMLADHGLEGLDARGVIDTLDAQPVADRPQDLVASVGIEDLVVADAEGREAVLPMPEDEVYLAAAPYANHTHDCYLHSPTTCLGELRNETVHVRVVDSATGEVLLDEDRTTFDNGFVGMWLPRGIEAELTIGHAAGTTSATVSTQDPEAPTCLTELRLRAS
jgi:hypothetical protein